MITDKLKNPSFELNDLHSIKIHNNIISLLYCVETSCDKHNNYPESVSRPMSHFFFILSGSNIYNSSNRTGKGETTENVFCLKLKG